MEPVSRVQRPLQGQARPSLTRSTFSIAVADEDKSTHVLGPIDPLSKLTAADLKDVSMDTLVAQVAVTPLIFGASSSTAEMRSCWAQEDGHQG
jgi:hypothetical protein